MAKRAKQRGKTPGRDVDPDLHQIERQVPDCISVISWIRICIKTISWARVRINSQMTSQNVWNRSRSEHFFEVLSLQLETRIRIRTASKCQAGSATLTRGPFYDSKRLYLKTEYHITTYMKKDFNEEVLHILVI